MPRKYATEEERQEAIRASKRRSAQRRRQAKGGKAKSWLRSAAKIMEPAAVKEERHAEPQASGETPRNPTDDGPELPGVSLPGFEPAATGDGASPTGSEGSQGGGPGGSDEHPASGSDKAPADETKKVDNKEVVAMLAGMYAGALKAGSEYAMKNDRMGLPDELIKINYDCMHLILTKQLATADIDSEEAAAYFVVGSSAWVGFNCFMAYKAKNPPKKVNQPAGVTADAATPVEAPRPVNGTNGKPPTEQAQGLVIRDAAPKQAGGVYK